MWEPGSRPGRRLPRRPRPGAELGAHPRQDGRPGRRHRDVPTVAGRPPCPGAAWPARRAPSGTPQSRSWRSRPCPARACAPASATCSRSRPPTCAGTARPRRPTACWDSAASTPTHGGARLSRLRRPRARLPPPQPAGRCGSRPCGRPPLRRSPPCGPPRGRRARAWMPRARALPWALGWPTSTFQSSRNVSLSLRLTLQTSAPRAAARRAGPHRAAGAKAAELAKNRTYLRNKARQGRAAAHLA